MKFLITGANGMLAREIINKFSCDNEVIATDINELDITNEEEVLAFINKAKPQYIINCAAFTDVDMAEVCYDLAYKVNCVGARNLAKTADKYNATLIHISTDYVFKGDLDILKEYSEEDIKEPKNAYGITKLQGEQEIGKNTKQYYIFRTAWLYGEGKNNFVNAITKLGLTNDEIKVVGDQYGSPTYTKDLADIIYQAIIKKIPYGVYHATNMGYTTRYDFAKMILEKQNIKCDIISITTAYYETNNRKNLTKRPLNTKLSKDKLLNQGIVIPAWEDGLERYLEEIKHKGI